VPAETVRRSELPRWLDLMMMAVFVLISPLVMLLLTWHVGSSLLAGVLLGRPGRIRCPHCGR
jgi:hypothetical protein